MTLREQIKKSREIKDNSLNTYLSALRKLKSVLDGEKVKPPLESSSFLHNYKEVMKAVNKENKITSKKNKLTAIIVALSSEKPKKESLIDKYSNQLKNLTDKYTAFLKEQTKTETQEKNWITYDELIGVANKLLKEVKHREIHKTKKELNSKDYDILQQYLILRTYITFPIRNDYAQMRILPLKEFKKLPKEEQKKNNYLVLKSGNKKEFVLNQFKNQKHIGSKTLQLPPKLNKVVNLWLKHNKSGWYLTKTNKKDPMTPNLITKYLNKIFQREVGKKISSSLIRHIVISHYMRNDPTIKEQEKRAKDIENKFLHSEAMSKLYRKVDDDSKDVGEDKEDKEDKKGKEDKED